MTAALHTIAFIHPNLYKDSVALMRVAQRLLALPGVVNATLQMGNPANKEILQEAGLLGTEVASAGPSDIMVVVQARAHAAAQAAIDESKAQLAGQGAVAGSADSQAVVPRNLGMGLAQMGRANIVQISVPGMYAAAEALKAVKQGRNVFMFSDNVLLEQEVAIKHEAMLRGVLVMGPDCGTAIIGGVPLGFANNVRRGSIGIVAASGTGLQEVSTQIHRMGGGISHAIGTGGRDVAAQVGGATLLQGIALLGQDAATKLIAIICKPPAPEVAAKVMAALQAAGKPAVVLFLGSSMASPVRDIRMVHPLTACSTRNRRNGRLGSNHDPGLPRHAGAAQRLNTGAEPGQTALAVRAPQGRQWCNTAGLPRGRHGSTAAVSRRPGPDAGPRPGDRPCPVLLPGVGGGRAHDDGEPRPAPGRHRDHREHPGQPALV